MDVVPDRDLFDFIDSLGDDNKTSNNNNKQSKVVVVEEGEIVDIPSQGEEKEEVVEKPCFPPSNAYYETREYDDEGDVWSGIRDAFNAWSHDILDAEDRFKRTVNFRTSIEESIYRQQLDGFLTYQDIGELKYITDVWVKLLNALNCYGVGCDFVKRDIFTFLLELYTLRQINRDLFIETCLRL